MTTRHILIERTDGRKVKLDCVDETDFLTALTFTCAEAEKTGILNELKITVQHGKKKTVLDSAFLPICAGLWHLHEEKKNEQGCLI